MKVKEESKKAGLKFNIQKTKIMASDSITSWKIDGETVEIVTDFILGGSIVTADGDHSHEIKRRLLLGATSLVGSSDGKSVCLQCGRPGFNSWVGKMSWGRKWQPTPVFLPGKSHGRRSLVTVYRLQPMGLQRVRHN